MEVAFIEEPIPQYCASSFLLAPTPLPAINTAINQVLIRLKSTVLALRRSIIIFEGRLVSPDSENVLLAAINGDPVQFGHVPMTLPVIKAMKYTDLHLCPIQLQPALLQLPLSYDQNVR